MSAIHPAAIVDPGARLGAAVSVGPYAVIEADVVIGDGCAVGAHAVIKRYTRMGSGNRMWEHAVIGGEPQDVKFTGFASYVEIGSGNMIREGATIHRASREGDATRLGDNNFLMACSHVGHDCQVGNQVIIANGALLAGFVQAGDRAFISGNVAIHQFVRIGRLAMVGGLARVSLDCLPFMITEGSPARARGLNLVGLRRAGVSAQDIKALKQAFLDLRSGSPLEESLQRLARSPSPLVAELVEFIRSSPRGFSHPSRA